MYLIICADTSFCSIKNYMKTFLLVILLTVLVQNQTTRPPLVGGYRAYTDLTSLQFQNNLRFVQQQRPEVRGWQVTQVSRQLVNGFNWRIELSNGKNKATAVVYEQFDGTRQITSWTTDLKTDQQNHQNQDGVAQPAILPPTPIVGGFRTVENPSGELFEYALSQALQEDASLRRQDLIKTERQVVAGWNYRFTFKQNNAADKVITIFVPLDWNKPAAEPAQVPQLIVGGYRTEQNPSGQDFEWALAQALKGDGSLRRQDLIKTQSQVVAGMNYRFTFRQRNAADKVATIFVPLDFNRQEPQLVIEKIEGPELTVQPVQETPQEVPETPVVVPTLVEPEVRPTPIIVGGYSVVENPSGQMFEWAIDRALKGDATLRREDLVKTESQVVAGTNFRFTFRQRNAADKVVTVFVPLDYESQVVPQLVVVPPTPLPVLQPPITGAPTTVTDQDQIKQALDAIYLAFPIYKIRQYRVESATSQVVAGKNYRIKLARSEFDYVDFRVFIDLQRKATVTQELRVNVSGYTQQQINDVRGRILAKFSDIRNLRQSAIENIWPHRKGIKYAYRDSNQKSTTVYVYPENNQERIIRF